MEKKKNEKIRWSFKILRAHGEYKKNNESKSA